MKPRLDFHKLKLNTNLISTTYIKTCIVNVRPRLNLMHTIISFHFDFVLVFQIVLNYTNRSFNFYVNGLLNPIIYH